MDCGAISAAEARRASSLLIGSASPLFESLRRRVKSQGRWITEGATHSVSSRLVRVQG
jgi:hypothetical protein